MDRRLAAVAQPFLMEGRVEIGAAIADWATVATTTLSSTAYGKLLSYGVTVRDPAYEYTGTLAFRLMLNGAPFITNTNGTVTAGQDGSWTLERGSVVNQLPTLIHLSDGSTIVFQARRVSVAALAQTVDFSACGWTAPRNCAPCNDDDGKYRV